MHSINYQGDYREGLKNLQITHLIFCVEKLSSFSVFLLILCLFFQYIFHFFLVLDQKNKLSIFLPRLTV